MNPTNLSLRDQARAIWHAGVEAVRPDDLIADALCNPESELRPALSQARRILVVGAGKAGVAMSAAIERILADSLDRIEGIVNVPADTIRPLRAIHLHAARPAASNQPTAVGIEGAKQILKLAGSAGPNDVMLCLLSGGGSALLPAPAEGITLEDKQAVTLTLHACGATINEMNAVRKHLSRIKGGGLANTFTGKQLWSLIISDVIGDPLDVIASGPTAADPSTFADALAVLEKYQVKERVPAAVLQYLERGMAGAAPDTLKTLPATVHNVILANNAKALSAAKATAEDLGFRVVNLGAFIEGETQQVATALAGIVRSIRADGQPVSPPVCLLSGGETTVTLNEGHGQGGRNQEFALAAALYLRRAGLANWVVLSGGTDGEDGPTDAAGALADACTLARATELGLDPAAFLACHDAYTFFDATGDLLKTGLTQTNVMDVRLFLIN